MLLLARLFLCKTINCGYQIHNHQWPALNWCTSLAVLLSLRSICREMLHLYNSKGNDAQQIPTSQQIPRASGRQRLSTTYTLNSQNNHQWPALNWCTSIAVLLSLRSICQEMLHLNNSKGSDAHQISKSQQIPRASGRKLLSTKRLITNPHPTDPSCLGKTTSINISHSKLPE